MDYVQVLDRLAYSMQETASSDHFSLKYSASLKFINALCFTSMDLVYSIYPHFGESPQ